MQSIHFLKTFFYKFFPLTDNLKAGNMTRVDCTTSVSSSLPPSYCTSIDDVENQQPTAPEQTEPIEIELSELVTSPTTTAAATANNGTQPVLRNRSKSLGNGDRVGMIEACGVIVLMQF